MPHKVFLFLILIIFFVQCKQPLRVLSANLGNVDLFKCYEYKLCDSTVMLNIKKYIETWNPDILLLSELLNSKQLRDILPNGYDGICGKSVNRFTNQKADWNSLDSSHEHECIAWKKSKLSFIPNSDKSVFGRNDEYGKNNCPFDFTGFRVVLDFNGKRITAVTVHPNSRNANCRTFEIKEYWNQLVDHQSNTIIGGDFNCGIYNYRLTWTNTTHELQVPKGFRTIYSNGQYWDLINLFPKDPTVVAALGIIEMWIDHLFTNFGSPCTDCGKYYGTESLKYGVAVGGHSGHPRMDGGKGCDHRQLLADMWVE